MHKLAADGLPRARFVRRSPTGIRPSPIAVFGRSLPITRRRVFVSTWTIPIRVCDYRETGIRPVGSNASRAKRNTIRACSIDAAHKTLSIPARNSGSPAVSTRSTIRAANQDLPLPRGKLRHAVSIPGAVADWINRFWKGLSIAVTQNSPHCGAGPQAGVGGAIADITMLKSSTRCALSFAASKPSDY